MTDEILKLMKNRQQNAQEWHNVYRMLSKNIRMKCMQTKQEWLNENCEEIETLQNIDKIIKEMTKDVLLKKMYKM